MNLKLILPLFFIATIDLYGQHYLDYQLRLEPVWSRVADALGEAGSVESAEFSPNGKYIISGTKFDNSVVMWRTSDGTELWRQYTKQEIERASWSSDNQYVAACSEDFLVTVYEAKTGEVVKEIEHDSISNMKISTFPSFVLVNSIFLPSGDHWGLAYSAP